MSELFANILEIGALVILALALVIAGYVTKHVSANIGQFGNDANGKRIATQKALANFYLAFASVLISAVGALKLIGHELFIALLIATLVGLGVKMTLDISEKG